MPIVVLRIDDRLVHGQIVQGWLKNIDIERIVVASDLVAQDEMQKLLISMAIPSDVSFCVKSVDEVANNMQTCQFKNEKIMILVSSPKDALRIIEKNTNIKSVNVGGMHFINGKRQLLANLSVDDEDIKILYSIYLKGVELEGRILPLDERINLIPIIEKEYKNIGK